MDYFCFNYGFARFISGHKDYSPIARHYWISPYYSDLYNANYKKYVRQGYLKCFPEWDSQEALFSNAKFYDPEKDSGNIIITRNKITDEGNLEKLETYKLTSETLKEFIFEDSNVSRTGSRCHAVMFDGWK